MTIDRENCEAWFLDYYEGNLSKEGVEEMFAFLILHPDLREVFDSYDEVSFAPDSKIQFDSKMDLKKTVKISEGIDASNYEEYFVGAVENVLSAEEKKELEQFLEMNPDKRAELELLRQTILEPEPEIVFENKSALKKSVLVTETNFEEYAVMALEGELSAEALVQFNAFLAAHPAQQKEYALFAQTKLQPETDIVFEGKAGLKKTPLVVTAENFDELAISSVEGLLNAEEEKTFAAAIVGNAEQQKSFALYQQTKLQADASVVFEDKELLKRKNRGGFWWSTGVRFAAAASVALLVGIFWWNYSGTNPAGDKGVIAKVDTLNNHSHNSNNNSTVPNDVMASNTNANDVVHHNSITNPVQTNDSVAVKNVPSNNVPLLAATSIALNGNWPSLQNKIEPDANFSDAFYNAADYGTASVNSNKSISAGQYAMRWMKKKLDRSAESKNGDEDVYQAIASNKNENVSGFDLTSSAVNALGEATGSNLHLAKNVDGTVLTVGKYRVWLNHRGN